MSAQDSHAANADSTEVPSAGNKDLSKLPPVTGAGRGWNIKTTFSYWGWSKYQSFLLLLGLVGILKLPSLTGAGRNIKASFSYWGWSEYQSFLLSLGTIGISKLPSLTGDDRNIKAALCYWGWSEYQKFLILLWTVEI